MVLFMRPHYGIDVAGKFFLVAMPTLVDAVLRLPYVFAASLLLVPMFAFGLVLQNRLVVGSDGGDREPTSGAVIGDGSGHRFVAEGRIVSCWDTVGLSSSHQTKIGNIAEFHGRN